MATEQSTDDSRIRRVRENLTQPTIRLVLALVILFVIRTLLTAIPGTDAVVYDYIGGAVTVATVLYTGVTLLIFAAIIRYASTVGATLARVFNEFPEVERMMQLVGALIVLTWAYQLFDWVPYFRDNPAQYDYVFLLLGVGFGGWLGYLLYTNVDKFSEYISTRSVNERGETTTTSKAESTENETSTVTCPECNTEAPRDADFCSSCGTTLANQKGTANHIADQV
jgi:ribosomal protein S27E